MAFHIRPGFIKPDGLMKLFSTPEPVTPDRHAQYWTGDRQEGVRTWIVRQGRGLPAVVVYVFSLSEDDFRGMAVANGATVVEEHGFLLAWLQSAEGEVLYLYTPVVPGAQRQLCGGGEICSSRPWTAVVTLAAKLTVPSGVQLG